MPALDKPRHEAFAQAIVQGLSGQTHAERAASTAYRAAGYQAKEGNSAEAAASRLLRRVKPILKRVMEIQEEARRKRGVTLESISAELDEARDVAKQNDQASAMVAASATKARLYGLEVKRVEQGNPGDFTGVQSTQDMARRQLEELGLANPTQADIDMAIGEMQRHARALEAIASRAVNA